jgi:hypothetical protein
MSSKHISSRKAIQTPEDNENGQKIKKRISGIALILFIVIGTAIIAAAVIVVLNFIFAKNLTSNQLTDNLDDFLELYNNNISDRDIPRGMTISKSVCTIDRTNGRFTIDVELKNSRATAMKFTYNAYFSEEYVAVKGSKSSGAFSSATGDNSISLNSGDKTEITVTGLLPENVTDSKISSMFDYIYLEIKTDTQLGRISVPLTIASSSS